ncbi:MAG: transporter substrate-binding domain-containing protein [Gammaproteobacteria bacterium]
MKAFRRDQAIRVSLFALLLVTLVPLLYSSGAAAFFNRTYSTLAEAQSLKGDFDDIIRSGKLRILLTQDFTSVVYLPRKSSPLADQQRTAEEFALSHGLIPELIIVDNFSELIPALVAGKGDIIINNLTINDERRKKISFSIPVAHVREQVVVRRDDNSIKRVRDLSGKKVMVNRDSTFWHALVWLKKNKYPDLEILEIPDNQQTERLLDRLAAGEFDATILDSNLIEIYLGYRSDIKVAVPFSGKRDIGWGIRKDAPKLVSEINRYLQLENVADDDTRPFTGDFDQIKKRKVLRVMLRNNAASYFLYRGELMGFEYELARQFARYHGLRFEVVVPPGHKELSTWLLEGKADMAMAFLVPSKSQRRLGIEYTQPYHYALQHMVVAKNDKVNGLSDMRRYTVIARKNGSHWNTLSELQRQGGDFNIKAVRDNVETEQLIQQVADEKRLATLADEHILDIELTREVAVKSAFTLEEDIPHSIAIRARNPLLKAQLDAFIKRVYRSEFYNVLYKKYFKSKRSVLKLSKGRVVDPEKGEISPFDKTVQKYSEHYGFDWRLITAQMYQESGFNPKAKSYAGAKGLMQIMPRTAKSLGIKDVGKPDNGIKAGVKYMDWLRDRFNEDLAVADRLWFSLAAYNAGAGHVHDARRLARQMGLDPDKWFANTESAMLMLSKKEFSKKARYGFVNGKEPVNYVREIKQRFEAYVSLSGTVSAGNDDAPQELMLASQ